MQPSGGNWGPVIGRERLARGVQERGRAGRCRGVPLRNGAVAGAGPVPEGDGAGGERADRTYDGAFRSGDRGNGNGGAGMEGWAREDAPPTPEGRNGRNQRCAFRTARNAPSSFRNGNRVVLKRGLPRSDLFAPIPNFLFSSFEDQKRSKSSNIWSKIPRFWKFRFLFIRFYILLSK